ncbi:site-specific tyrosine recombinase XerD [Schaalia turicensis]|uniref:Tyrosine recombinase XerC n=1 Tax=Schaalia turicensis TaxID=131111 RepID=A0A2I1I4Y5_9ACTO|nr:site-specific tyrosine recombinase XerD [Schaalia turicensis]PKY66153.1 site-specific tyrosine recombinase XerD [Schaalia turicensis]
MSEIGEYIDEWLGYLRVERGSSINTVSNYKRDIERYRLDLESHGISDLKTIKSADIERHLADLSAGTVSGKPAAASSIARASAAIRSFHTFVSATSPDMHNPAARITSPKQGSHLPQALSVEQVSALLDAARVGDDVTSLRDSALLELLYATGARVSEAVGLALDDLDLDEALPVIRLFGKGRKERIVPLGSYAKAAIEAYIVRSRPVLAQRGQGSPALFLNSRGRALSRQSAWEIIQRAAGRAGIDEDVSPHTLRHSFATHLLEGGASIRDVQELLGHASVQTTQIYTRVTPTTLKEVYQLAHPRAKATHAN